MNIDTPIRELGSIDVTDLRETILALEDVAWEEDQYRQDEYEVHTATKSILMIFVDTSRWPDIKVTREVGWDRLANVALPLMNEIIENKINVRIPQFFNLPTPRKPKYNELF